ncbi:MAG: bifunctional riboflavin kinase/FAD synthetase [Deltaproteobacteria bacterium]|jgi:riboflavin kinase/FMN adenylyltransferase|nr:bifunctional riboflavin kinase/FAD synthetase [Deltaproteobacteria bacterium]
MITTNSLSAVQDQVSLTLVIGNFDGVHAGHSHLLKFAVNLGLMTGVFTFEPHPVSILFPHNKLEILTTRQQKNRIFQKYGLEFTVYYPFIREFADSPPEEFAKLLAKKKNLKYVVVGEDFHFGRNRSGNPELLQDLLHEYGIQLIVFPVHCCNSSKISSSAIRRLIKDGKIVQANKMLGRNYSIQGKVVSGQGIGKTLGFPTANIESIQLYPGSGVYSGEIKIEGDKPHQAVISIGRKETFGCSNAEIMEVHVLDFEKNLYNHEVEVCFVTRIRDQQKFSSPEELKAQIKRDLKSL